MGETLPCLKTGLISRNDCLRDALLFSWVDRLFAEELWSAVSNRRMKSQVRTIGDAEGNTWDIAVGKESYGVRVLIFSVRGGHDIRKSVMQANSQLAAVRELESMSDDDLCEFLRLAEPWS